MRNSRDAIYGKNMNCSGSNQAKKGKFSSHSRNESSSTLSAEEEKEPAKTQMSFPGKFKTQICKKWKLGKCEFGEKCTFAHGKHELRKTVFLIEYNPPNKTKKCIPFSQTGYCVYGSKCLYLHDENEFKKLQKQKEKTEEKEKNKTKEKGEEIEKAKEKGKQIQKVQREQVHRCTDTIHRHHSNIPVFLDLERRNIYLS